MGYKNFNELEGSSGEGGSNTITLSGSELSVSLPDVSFVKDADISRDGMDLVLNGPQGEVIIDGYFAAPDAPTLVAPDGSSLSPQLVNSFVKSKLISSILVTKKKIYSRALEWKIINTEKFLKKFF